MNRWPAQTPRPTKPRGGAAPRRRPGERLDHVTSAACQRREGQGPRHPRRHPHAQAHRARSSGRPPPDERQALARFGGFGPVALSIFPDPVTGRYKDAGWQALGEELQSLLTPEEYDSAKRTTFNAFYTSPTVIAAMHEALARLGVPARRHRPGAGLRHRQFHGPWPRRACASSASSWIASPAASPVRCTPTTTSASRTSATRKLPEGSIDAVIGNVPFADVKLDYRGQKLSLHDFFFAKSLDALKPGGVLALVTSHFTLDKQNAAIREYLAERGRFPRSDPPAVRRLQARRHGVVTDIVFLRKRAAGEPASHADPDWLDTAPLAIEGAEVPINRYFLNHPEMVLGTWSRKDRLYDDGYSVTGNGDLAEQLARRHPPPARRSLPPQLAAARPKPAPAFTPPPPERHIAEGSFFVGDDRIICQVDGGQAVPVVYGGTLLKADGTHDRQAARRPGRPARPRPPRPAIAERRLARGAPQRRPPRAEPRLRPLRRRLRPDQQDHLRRDRRRHASSAACPTS